MRRERPHEWALRCEGVVGRAPDWRAISHALGLTWLKTCTQRERQRRPQGQRPARAKTSPLHDQTPSKPNETPRPKPSATKRTQKRRANPARPTPDNAAAPPISPGAPTKPNATRRTHERARCHGGDARGGGGTLCAEAPEPRKRHPTTHKTAAGTDKRESRTNGARQRPPTEPSEPGKPNATKRTHKRGKGPRQTEKTGRKNETRDPRRAAAAERTTCTNEANSPGGALLPDGRGACCGSLPA